MNSLPSTSVRIDPEADSIYIGVAGFTELDTYCSFAAASSFERGPGISVRMRRLVVVVVMLSPLKGWGVKVLGLNGWMR